MIILGRVLRYLAVVLSGLVALGVQNQLRYMGAHGPHVAMVGVLVFAPIVLALAGLGTYLIRRHHQ